MSDEQKILKIDFEDVFRIRIYLLGPKYTRTPLRPEGLLIKIRWLIFYEYHSIFHVTIGKKNVLFLAADDMRLVCFGNISTLFIRKADSSFFGKNSGQELTSSPKLYFVNANISSSLVRIELSYCREFLVGKFF